MSVTRYAARRRRITEDEELVCSLNARIQLVELQRAAATQALEEARLKQEDLDAEALRIRTLLAIAERNMVEARAASLQALMATFPDDVLHGVFDALVDIPDKNWAVLGFGRYNVARARQPFALASVCRHWRRVALAARRLWTYISLPDTPLDDNAEAHFYRVSLSLARSGAMPLEVLLNVYHDVGDTLGMEKIYFRVAEQARRWRRVDLTMRTPQEKDKVMLDAFRGPLPLLEELAVVQIDRYSTPLEGCLPHVPRLHHLLLLPCPIHPPRYVSALPGLTNLELLGERSGQRVLQYIKLGQRTLTNILLDVRCADAPVASVTLPHLHGLTLRNKTFPFSPSGTPFLIAPHLRSLALHSEFFYNPHVGAFLSHFSGTVTELSLSGLVAVGALDELRTLHNISRLNFKADFYDEIAHIDDNFFSALASQPLVWPRLTSIVVADGGKVRSESGSNAIPNYSILDLLAERNTSAGVSSSAEPETEGPARIKEVILAYEGVPSWVLAEVERLLTV
ncbi:hypothetical protein EXIGLDRAFT_732242 [Exidia glandulosa HHB12029]|uniref:F-box domain-containing protein n=1 Tax=Exidia glandulosa HHB12029 TaxID=1314781 RepID=A0A165BLA6_EXIGL|nr:hypothetical protein EXIGLDRAFT_732242 [Exidia glandulosa HHB12029]